MFLGKWREIGGWLGLDAIGQSLPGFSRVRELLQDHVVLHNASGHADSMSTAAQQSSSSSQRDDDLHGDDVWEEWSGVKAGDDGCSLKYIKSDCFRHDDLQRLLRTCDPAGSLTFALKSTHLNQLQIYRNE